MRPLMAWISVDLPQPDGPAMSTFSPRRTVRLMSRSVGAAWAFY